MNCLGLVEVMPFSVEAAKRRSSEALCGTTWYLVFHHDRYEQLLIIYIYIYVYIH